MADKLSYDVGKKIVDALKMEMDVTSHDNSGMSDSGFTSISESHITDSDTSLVTEDSNDVAYSGQDDTFQNPFGASVNDNFSSIDAAFAKSVAQNLGSETIPINVELPSNVAVLNSLIAKLPVGVSKQTGALIIKQTMEALGISMSSVLQEARQVQENYISCARECQKNILDYKNQIGILDQKAKMCQNQAVAMNDVISLFSNVSL